MDKGEYCVRMFQFQAMIIFIILLLSMQFTYVLNHNYMEGFV